jgi:hypothetical protein
MLKLRYEKLRYEKLRASACVALSNQASKAAVKQQ